jgi:hypothetical protein
LFLLYSDSCEERVYVGFDEEHKSCQHKYINLGCLLCLRRKYVIPPDLTRRSRDYMGSTSLTTHDSPLSKHSSSFPSPSASSLFRFYVNPLHRLNLFLPSPFQRLILAFQASAVPLRQKGSTPSKATRPYETSSWVSHDPPSQALRGGLRLYVETKWIKSHGHVEFSSSLLALWSIQKVFALHRQGIVNFPHGRSAAGHSARLLSISPNICTMRPGPVGLSQGLSGP